ncbi:hypothetical protein [Gracilibacillus saliphilus]|uniref:hypothetical protein n=1 Tax=Gracilibacillus saliphilus TaxID=543890 RepID=UPI0013D25295|nr:hypothetical protein [Gracilibacillus saliphilus]
MEGRTDIKMFTSIHTNINKDYRISTIYRKYENMNFTSWAWETLVWKGETIVEMESSDSLDEVMETHKTFYEKYSVRSETNE